MLKEFIEKRLSEANSYTEKADCLEVIERTLKIVNKLNEDNQQVISQYWEKIYNEVKE